MSIFISVVLFIIGALIIIKGGDFFVDASTWISDVTGISKVVIGATLVSFATTAPEYFVSLFAVIKGSNDLSIGNAVGSLICNIGTAFALVAIFRPGKVSDKKFASKGFIMIVAAACLWIFCFNGLISVLEGLALLLIFVIFTFLNIRYSKDSGETNQRHKTNSKEITTNILKFIVGALAIVLGSNLIVDNGQVIAAYMGVSEAIIGLTFVAIGTSLPEIVTSITAIVKKQSALSIGNIIGANVLDTTLILATGSFVSKGNLTVSSSTVQVDLPVTLFLMALAVVPTAIGKKLYRWQGIAIAGVYLVYLAYLAFFSA